VDSLFIVNWTGTLTEYILEPRAKSGLEKVTDESPVEVLARAWAQWPLARLLSFSAKLLVITLHASKCEIVGSEYESAVIMYKFGLRCFGNPAFESFCSRSVGRFLSRDL